MTFCNKSVHHRVFSTVIPLVIKQELNRENYRNLEWDDYHDPWKFHQDEYWLKCLITDNFSMLLSEERTHIQKCYFSFSFFPPLYFFPLLWWSELQAPTRPEASTQLGLWTGFLPHEFGGRVSRNDISTFNFQNTHSGTDVFYRDCKMKFRNKGAWIMFWYNMVRDHCMKLIPADSHNLSLWKLVYNICV